MLTALTLIGSIVLVISLARGTRTTVSGLARIFLLLAAAGLAARDVWGVLWHSNSVEPIEQHEGRHSSQRKAQD